MSNQTNVIIVPNILHLVYLNDHSIPYFIYLNILTMLINIHPDELYFNCVIQPSTEDSLWRSIVDFLLNQHIALKVIVAENPIQIWGRKPTNLAHKSDVIRIKSLPQYGRIYFDLDVIVIKSVSHMRKFPMTIAGEGDKNYGNTVLFSIPNGKFINAWFESYKNVDFSCWGCHSLVLPMKIAKEFPDSVNVIPSYSFYPIGFGREDSERLFGENPPSKSSDNDITTDQDVFGVHLWANNYHIHRFLKTVNASYVCNSRSLYARIIRASLAGTNSSFLSNGCVSITKIVDIESNTSSSNSNYRLSPYFTPYSYIKPPHKVMWLYHLKDVAFYINNSIFWQFCLVSLTILLVCCYFRRKGTIIIIIFFVNV